MSLNKKNTFFLSVLLLALPAWALDVNDTMSMRVSDILKHNVIVINRGISDGLKKNSHFKINDSQGYRSRALVLYSATNFSVVKVYRVIEKNNFSRSTKYILTSLKSSTLAPHMRRFTKRDFTRDFKDFKPGSTSKYHSVYPDFPKRTTRRELQQALSTKEGNKSTDN